MLTEKAKENIALKRFSLISPVINGQIKNQKQYFDDLCKNPIEMPHYGVRNYSPKTIRMWLNDYIRGGIDSLKPGGRSDKGKSRKITGELAQKIISMRKEKPNMHVSMLYEQLINEGAITKNTVALSTLYRFLEDQSIKGELKEEPEKEIKRFSHEHINEMWQADVMYGPRIRMGKSLKQTYLIAFLDDASRVSTYSAFYLEQSFKALRHALKEAVLRRGIPRMMYTDNGKIYRSEQLKYICASLGCALIHAQPFSPYQKGKIERFFRTVRTRFLAQHYDKGFKNLDELNTLYLKWLQEDYHNKKHSSLNMTPLDFFISQGSRIKMVSDPRELDEKFLMRISRKIQKDATFQIEKELYETDMHLTGQRYEIRYNPETINNPENTVLIYNDGMKIGEARRVNFHDNAHIKRRFGKNRTGKGKTTASEASDYTVDQEDSPSILYRTIITEERSE